MGATKIVLYRWIYLSGGQATPTFGNATQSGNTSYAWSPIRNRIFFRIVEPQSGAVIWSDYIEYTQQSSPQIQHTTVTPMQKNQTSPALQGN